MWITCYFAAFVILPMGWDIEVPCCVFRNSVTQFLTAWRLAWPEEFTDLEATWPKGLDRIF